MSCEIYQNSSVWTSVVSIGLAIGIFASYIPQIYAVWHHKSVRGINAGFLFLLNLSCDCSFFNLLLLSTPVFQCCKSGISSFDCFTNVMGIVQLGMALLGPLLVLVMCFKFGNDFKIYTYILLGINLIILLLYVVLKGMHNLFVFATLLGTIALFAGSIQFIPQIITTYKLKTGGSLSKLMMFIQVPGAYIWALSLALDKDSNWSTWLPIFTAATFQLVLLVMLIYYNRNNVSYKPVEEDEQFEIE